MTLITAKVEADMKDFSVPRPIEIPVGAYGIFQVPSLDIAIPVYETSYKTQTQNVVDCETSASIRKWGSARIIEDHLDSVGMGGKGVWNVSDFKPDTVAFLVTEKVTYCYKAYLCCRCQETSHSITLNGKPLWPARQTNIVCASCADRKSDDIYYAEFRLTGMIPT
jgi:hypothetical protein